MDIHNIVLKTALWNIQVEEINVSPSPPYIINKQKHMLIMFIQSSTCTATVLPVNVHRKITHAPQVSRWRMSTEKL